MAAPAPAAADAASSPSPAAPSVADHRPAAAPSSHPEHTSFRQQLDHGPPLHFFTDPRAEEEARPARGDGVDELATVCGTPTATSWTSPGEKEGPSKEADVIFVVFDEVDPRDPFQFSRRRKWAITCTACTYTILVSWALSCYSIASADMQRDLGLSNLGSAAGISLYAWGFGIAPMFLSPIAEELGRNPMYIGSAALFTLFILPCALAQNLQTILVSRFILGVAGSTGSTMVGGSLADMWRNHERGLPMSCFAAAALLGIALGAMSMGYVAERVGWRVVQWIFFGLMAAFMPVMVLVMKETRGAVLLTRLARKKRKETGDDRYRSHAELERPSMMQLVKISATRPFYFLISEPVVTALSLWIGFAWGVLYGVLEALPFVLERLHGFSTGQVGLAYLTFLIAVALGFIANLYQDRLYTRYYPTYGPEARLFGACAAGLIFPAGCFIFAWTSYANIHWIAPCIGLSFAIFGIFQIYLSVFNYLSDAYSIYASSALAAQSFSRNAFAGAFPLFITGMYERLNPRWAATVFGCIAAILGIVPWVLVKYGPRLRAASKVAQSLAELKH